MRVERRLGRSSGWNWKGRGKEVGCFVGSVPSCFLRERDLLLGSRCWVLRDELLGRLKRGWESRRLWRVGQCRIGGIGGEEEEEMESCCCRKERSRSGSWEEEVVEEEEEEEVEETLEDLWERKSRRTKVGTDCSSRGSDSAEGREVVEPWSRPIEGSKEGSLVSPAKP